MGDGADRERGGVVRAADSESVPPSGRRAFFKWTGGAIAALGGSTFDGSPRGVRLLRSARAEVLAPDGVEKRRNNAYRLRVDAAVAQKNARVLTQTTNGDEEAFANAIASFTKALPHDDLGHVDRGAYDMLRAALSSGKPEDFERVPMGGTAKLASPQSAYAYSLDGADAHALTMRPPPTFRSAQMAADMVELYWQALARDVPFDQYATNARIADAADDLSRLSAFTGPKAGGRVTPSTVFRGQAAGDLVGPYVSQFLYLDTPHGAGAFIHRYRVPLAGDDHMKTVASWLSIQRGGAPGSNALDPTLRYIRTGRDLGEFVHRDFSVQAYLNACLYLLKAGPNAFHPSNPYLASRTQRQNVTFGEKHILDMMCRMAFAAEKASWYQKWLVHRRLRPEAYGGRVHQHLSGAASYPLPAELLSSSALAEVYRENGTYLLPMAYPEGSPTHPSYPAAHAATAAACVTALKAFFNPDFVIPQPVVPSPDGLSLVRYSGPSLTVQNELDKLAANVALGRDFAGVHYRSDSIEGMRLGEDVALSLLREWRVTVNEPVPPVTIVRFDGTRATIG
jgi:hypothetical protein